MQQLFSLVVQSANDEEPEVDVDKLREDCELLQLQLESELMALKAAVAGGKLYPWGRNRL